jgi:glycosyltransferase involved in cell wall biosynthesis
MRVGLVVPGFSANVADWCIPALRHLARELARSDDVRIIAVRYPYARSRYTVDGADVIAIGGASRRGSGSLDLWRTTLSVVRAEHRQRPFDVLHAFWATESGLLTALAGRLLGVPTLVSLAGGELAGIRDIEYGDQRQPWERLKVQASLRLASAVSAGSRWLMEMALRHVQSSRLHRAPLGVPLDLFHPRSQEGPNEGRRDGPALLHVATLVPVKDQLTLLRAFAALRRQQPLASLTIVGDGPLRSQLATVAHALDLEEAVQFRGDLDHGSLPDVYRASDAFVLSSRHEAQGMVALEAAACGLAVAGTRVGIIPELTCPDVSVAPIADPAALAVTLVSVSAAARPAASYARRVAETDFSLPTCTDRFRRLYAELAHA